MDPTTHINIPDRLHHLYDLPFAHFIGTSLAGVDWVAYRPENVEPLTRRFRVMLLKQRLGKSSWR